MEFIKNMLKGVLIGISNVIPGASGATVAVSLGIFDKLVKTVNNSFDELKKSFKQKNVLKALFLAIKKIIIENKTFIIPLILGAGIGIVFLAKLITTNIDTYSYEIFAIFLAFIVGSLPSVIYESKKDIDKYNKSSSNFEKIGYFLSTFILLILLTIFKENNLIMQQKNIYTHNFIDMFTIFICGIISAFAMIIPGISGSMVLMLLGQYKATMLIIDKLDILLIVVLMIGIIIGIVLATKVIDYLFNKSKINTYAAIFGFIIASILSIIYSEFKTLDILSTRAITVVIIFIVSLVVSYGITMIAKKDKVK